MNATPPFWKTKRLEEMTEAEWEALCDGCAKCCAFKLEDEDTGEILFTCIACRLLDLQTCRCLHYARRHELVPECAPLSTDHPERFAWLPETCAYRRIHEGRPLPEWHPLLTGDPESPHAAGASARKKLIPEALADLDHVEKYVVE